MRQMGATSSSSNGGIDAWWLLRRDIPCDERFSRRMSMRLRFGWDVRGRGKGVANPRGRGEERLGRADTLESTVLVLASRFGG